MNRPMEAIDRSWAASPCSSCRTSPCCTRLPLHRFHIESRNDFDRALDLLRYPRVELGLYETGWWMAYLLSPCRFLNPLDSKCLVHASNRQPTACKEYSPLRCWYKRVFHDGISPDFIRFDAPRLRALQPMLTFDEAGELAGVPEWEQIQALPPPANLTHSPRAVSSSPPPGLHFPLRVPRTQRDLDMIRFRLGFHGVRIGISPQAWAIILGRPAEAARYHTITYDHLVELGEV